jgi:hypothetical protein
MPQLRRAIAESSETWRSLRLTMAMTSRSTKYYCSETELLQ